jgi:hypothetical protein
MYIYCNIHISSLSEIPERKSNNPESTGNNPESTYREQVVNMHV